MKKTKRRILITGATGFIGANLTRALLAKGEDVHIIIRRESNMWRIAAILKKLTVHTVDIRDERAIGKLLQRLRPRHIYHLAAYGGYSFQADMNKMIDTNIHGTVTFLTAASSLDSLDAFIHAGSSTEYGFKSHAMRETDFVEPNTAYGAAKAAQTLWCQFFAKNHGLPIVIIRPSLVFGYYEEPTRLIPSTILAHMRHAPLHLSSPFPKKDFVFIEDVLDAFYIAAEQARRYRGHIFNIASGEEYSVGEVVFLIRRVMGTSISFKWGEQAGRTWDTENVWVDDISKAKKLLGWKPRHTFEAGLLRDIAWFKKYHMLYP